jgi:asparagine synthase (glutamine-hydrolysing)
MHTEAYYKYRYRPEHGGASPAEVGERISACLKESSPAYLGGPARKGFFLSGGLDSRIVAGAIGPAEPALHAFTFGYPESRDVVYAAELSRRLGYEHHVLTYPDVYLSKVIRDVVARTECTAPFYHATSVLFHDRVAEHADAIVVGFCGDVFSGGHLRPAMFKLPPGPELTGLIFHRAQCAGKDEIARIFRPEALDRYWPLFVESFRASVDSISGQSGPDTADVWDVENRQRRFTFSAPKVDRSRFEVVAPLLDRRFVDLVTTLPIQARRRQIAYRHAIVSGFPELRSVPWAATGRPIELNPVKDRVQEAARLGSKAFTRALARLGLRREGLEWRFRDIAEEMRNDAALFNEHLDPFLDSDRFPEDLFNRQGIRDLVKRHKGGADASHLLGTLLTVAVFTDLF